MSSSLRRALSLAAVVLCSVLSVSLAQQATCPSPFVTSHFNNASYGMTYTISEHIISLTSEYLSQPQTVQSVGLQLAARGNPSMSYNLRLGLYQRLNNTLFVRLGQTDNIPITGAQAFAGLNLYAPLQSAVPVTAGTYYVARLSDQNGLQVWGDGLFTESAEDVLFYNEGMSLPNLVMRNFSATAVRAAIVGCPLDAGAVGDPTFYGFKGQVYQVHGIAGYLFNLLTSSDLQVNARFDFIDAGVSMTQGEQSNLRSTDRSLPNTPAWSHAGTYLGELGVRLSRSSLRIVPGAYLSGFESVTVDSAVIDMSAASYPAVILQTSTAVVTLVSAHVIRIATPLLRFDIVNSDHFANIQRAQLLSSAPQAATQLDGILGQSADASRWFPAYEGSVDASADVKGEWQQAQIHDFLIVDSDIYSTDFQRNKFQL